MLRPVSAGIDMESLIDLSYLNSTCHLRPSHFGIGNAFSLCDADSLTTGLLR